MGIDTHALHFLRYAGNQREFGKTITIGRQGLHVPESLLRSAVWGASRHNSVKSCEALFMEYFGSSVVDSVDNSSYEGASIVHDLNKPIPSVMRSTYDTVFDGGCLEHIFNVPQALMNCSMMCKSGGQVLHVLPANNFCGHGFWQFSPELFFSLYSKANGYRETEVFLADLADTTRWFKVKAPTNGRRVIVHSSTDLYVLVRTVLQDDAFSHDDVQQSDYAYQWKQEAPRVPEIPTSQRSNVLKERIRRSRAFGRFIFPFYYRKRIRAASKLCHRNPGLEEFDFSRAIPALSSDA